MVARIDAPLTGAAAARGRKPGRPVSTTAHGDQRLRLVDAALSCFVRDGIAGATVRGIAAQAGVTPALTHYYLRGVGLGQLWQPLLALLAFTAVMLMVAVTRVHKRLD